MNNLLCSHSDKNYFSFKIKNFLCHKCLILDQKVKVLISSTNLLKQVTKKYKIIIGWNDLLFFQGLIYFYENTDNKISYVIEIVQNEDFPLVEHFKKDFDFDFTFNFHGSDEFEEKLLSMMTRGDMSIDYLKYVNIDEFLEDMSNEGKILVELPSYKSLINFNEYMLSIIKKSYLKEIDFEFPDTSNFPNCISDNYNIPFVELFIPINNQREISGMINNYPIKFSMDENTFSMSVVKGNEFIGFIECELRSLLSIDFLIDEFNATQFSKDATYNHNYKLWYDYEKTKKEKPRYNYLYLKNLLINDKFLNKERDLKVVELLLYHILLFIKNAAKELDVYLVFSEFTTKKYDKQLMTILNRTFSFSNSLEKDFPYDVLFLKNVDFLARMRFYANKINTCLLKRKSGFKRNIFFDINELNSIFQ